MKKILSILACLAMIVVGGVTLAACGEPTPTVNNVTELYAALEAQKDGDTIVLKAGTYDIAPMVAYAEQPDEGNWYLPIWANNVTIKGQNGVVLMSSHDSENGIWSSQNFMTVFGDNFTLENVTLVCKKEVNKVIEVLGKNVTLKNVTCNAPSDYDFAGSIYFNNVGIVGNTAGDVGTATFENVTLNKGRITGSGALTGKFVFNNVEIDWTGVDEGTRTQAGILPIYKLNQHTNTESSFTYEGTETVSVKLNKTELGDSIYQAAKDELPEGVQVLDVNTAA